MPTGLDYDFAHYSMKAAKSISGLFVAAALCFAGCDGVTYPPRSMVYKPVYAAVKNDKALPAGAVVDPRNNARLYIAKNAAEAEVEYDFTDASGKKATGIYLVYMKRVNRRWELDHCFPMPEATNAPGASSLLEVAPKAEESSAVNPQ